jgi:hypothetical protein
MRRIAGYAGGKADSQRRRLQRFLRQGHNLAQFFQDWTGSVQRAIGQDEIVLAVDETKLKDQLGAMIVGLVVAGRAIPLAWQMYRANSAADYPAEGQAQLVLRLLKAVQAGLKPGSRVRVLADRGIGTSPALMRGIMAMGWHFLFRVTRQSKIVLPDGQTVTFHDQVQHAGQSWSATGLVFKKRGHIPAHVRVLWGEHAKARWALVTNDPSLSGWAYAQRMWIEEAFRDLKAQGWQIERAALDDPIRMAHLWILLVIAYAWLLLWGLAAVARGLQSAPKRLKNGCLVRRWSVFQEGRRAFLAACPPLFRF